MENHPEVVTYLLSQQADINLRNDSGYTALMYAAESDRREMALTLLAQEANISGQNAYQETVLMMMARNGETDIVERLIEMNADITATNRIGDTALYLTVDNGHAHTVRSLIRAGASVNTKNIGDWTPLIMASARGYLDIIALLLENGADVNSVNRQGRTALDEAKDSFRARDAIAQVLKFLQSTNVNARRGSIQDLMDADYYEAIPQIAQCPVSCVFRLRGIKQLAQSAIEAKKLTFAQIQPSAASRLKIRASDL